MSRDNPMYRLIENDFGMAYRLAVTLLYLTLLFWVKYMS